MAQTVLKAGIWCWALLFNYEFCCAYLEKTWSGYIIGLTKKNNKLRKNLKKSQDRLCRAGAAREESHSRPSGALQRENAKLAISAAPLSVSTGNGGCGETSRFYKFIVRERRCQFRAGCETWSPSHLPVPQPPQCEEINRNRGRGEAGPGAGRAAATGTSLHPARL